MAVLYSLKGKKIYKPDFPTEGLVCYLNTEGKTNSDIHRAKLLDLSGNGNDGILTGFDFTESSGYVKGLSGGTSGLQFDGVDDRVTISRDFTFAKKPFTYFVDFKILRTAVEQDTGIDLGFGFYIHRGFNKMFNYLTNQPAGLTYGDAEIGVGRHIFTCSMGEDFTKTKYFLDGKSISIQNKLLSDGTPVSFIDRAGDIYITAGGTKKINKLMIWNRQLTDEEITKLMEE